MSNEIFRQKSLDKIKSPENLSDYIRVTNPGLWALLIAVILILAGACVWGFFGRLDSTVSGSAVVGNGKVVCYVSSSDVKEGMTIRIDGKECTITKVSISSDQLVCLADVPEGVEDGNYDVKIVTESVKPFSFVIN